MVFAGGQKIVDLRWTGNANNHVAFAVTAGGLLLRGAGEPFVWTQLTFAPNVSFSGILYDDALNSSRVLFGASWGSPLLPPSATPMRLFATSTSGPLSSDYYELQLPAGSWAAIGARPHPLNPDVLALFVTQTPASLGCQLASILALSAACIKNDVLVTTDFGRSGVASWTSVAAASGYGGFVDFAWSPRVADASDLSLLVTAYEDEQARLQGWYYNGYWDPALSFKFTNARIGDPTNFRVFNGSVSSCGNAFTVGLDGKIWLSRSASCNGTQTGPRTGAGLDAVIEVLDSSLPKEQWAWKLGCFPVPESSRFYNLFDTGVDGSAADRQLFVLVDKAVDDPLVDAMPVGILYAADASGTDFTLSLPWVLRPDDPLSHLSTAGDALSNPAIVGLAAVPAVLFAETVDVLSLAQDPAYLRRDKSALDALATRVSRDSGATWRPLVGAGLPGCDAGSVSVGCQLHLHTPMMETRDGSGLHFTGVYSSAAAPNVVLSTGNTGAYLSLYPNATSTFLSLDAGVHWTKIASSSQTYEIAANGGLLLLAEDKGTDPVGCVYYASAFRALDWSASWSCAQLSPPAARITSMQARPGSLHVVVYGVDAGGDTLIYTLDFKTPAPDLPALPACTPSDLLPLDSQSCRFGENLQFAISRKPASDCIPPPQSAPTFVPCGCGPADAVCGWGWFATNTSAGQSPICHPLDASTFNAQPGCPAQSSVGLVANPNNLCGAPPPGPAAGGGTGALVGGVVGTVAGLAALGVLVWAARKGWLGACCRKRVAAPRQLSADDEEWIMQGSGNADAAGSYAPPPSVAIF